jgi:integrase
MTTRSFGTIRRLKSTRYQARYVGPDGRRHTADRTFTAKSHASKWLSKTETEISNGAWVVPGREVATTAAWTFGAYADAWLAQNTLKPRTRSEYRRLLNGTRLATFRPRDITAITSPEVKEWFGGLPQTPTENAHAYSLLSTVMNAAVEDENCAVTVNPCRVKNAGSVKRAKLIRVLSDQQVETLANAEVRIRALVLVSAYCCLRFGELTELRRRDFVDGELRIRRAVTWVEPDLLTPEQLATVNLIGRNGRPLKKVPVVGPPKSSAGVRDIPVPGFLRSILAEHILASAEPGDDGLVFPAAQGGWMAHGSLYAAFSGARTAIERKDLSWHDLRHTGAVSWALETATIKELMTLLGHETPTMAVHYQHVAEGRLTALAERVSQRVTGNLVAEETTIDLNEEAAQ